MIKTGMSKKEFEEWRNEWYLRIPGCKEFVCCHELTACGVEFLCGDCSIYSTYQNQESPIECSEIKCQDCLSLHECKKNLICI